MLFVVVHTSEFCSPPPIQAVHYWPRDAVDLLCATSELDSNNLFISRHFEIPIYTNSFFLLLLLVIYNCCYFWYSYLLLLMVIY